MYWLVILLLALPLLIAYLYVSLSLRALGLKLFRRTDWKAWVPIANFVYLCQLAEKPVWWVLLGFIPLVGLLIFIPLWMGVARRVGKPAWLGALALFFPFPVMGIIAGFGWPRSLAITALMFGSIFALPFEIEGLLYYGAFRDLGAADASTRTRAAVYLGQTRASVALMRPWYRKQEVVAVLTAALLDEHPHVRRTAEQGLRWQFGNRSRQTILQAILPVVVEGLRRGYRYSDLPRDLGAEAVPSLLELLQDPSPGVRDSAASALTDIAFAYPDLAEKVEPALADSLVDSASQPRFRVAQYFMERQASLEAVIRVLVAALDHADDKVRGQALAMLVKIAQKYSEGVESIPPENLEKGYDLALARRIRKQLEVNLPALLSGLQRAEAQLGKSDPRPHQVETDARAEYFEILLALGSASVPALLDLLRRDSPFLRGNAARSLAGLAPCRPDLEARLIPLLIRMLGDKSAYVRSSTAEALGLIGPPARSASSALARVRGESGEPAANDARLALSRIASGGYYIQCPGGKRIRR